MPRSGSAWWLAPALTLLLMLVQAASQAKDVYVGNYRLHIACHGSGVPTVVLDAGLGGSALEWVRVQARLRHTTRVCSYDRAGYGASDAGPAPRTSSHIASELYLLLEAAGEVPPVILVGHSFGGYNMQLFAHRYPDLTAGLVLVDASHPAQVERLLAPPLALLTAPSNRAGVVHFRNPPVPHPLLPDDVRRRILIDSRSWKARRTLGDEMLAFRDSAREVTESRLAADDLPLVVLTRGRLDGRLTRKRRLLEQRWLELQTELAATSIDSAHLIAIDSGHAIHIEQPGLVAYAIAMLVQHYRAGLPVTAGGGTIIPALANHFELGGVRWLRDTLTLYPTRIAAGDDQSCVLKVGPAACVAPVDGAP